MKLSVQIALFTSTFLVVLVAAIATFTVADVRERGEVELQAFRKNTFADVERNLKDLVDVAYATIDENYSNLDDQAFLEKYYGHRLKNIVDAAESVVKEHAQHAREGKISREKAQQQALAEISTMRYDGGTGYIWVNDTGRPYPTMLMHPTVPELDGRVMDDEKYNTVRGTRKNLFQAFVEVGEKDGEGFVGYLWPKPTPNGLIPDVQKLSYVRLFKEWNWVLGTGIYIDDATDDILQKIKSDVRAMRYANGTGYFWINDTARPFPKMVMHPTIPALDGTVLDDPKYNSALGQNKNLFTAFVDAVNESGSGFVDYLWPKPTPGGLTEKQPKLSYVRLYEPLGWVIGTGVYVDGIDREVEEKETELGEQVNGLVSRIVLVAGFVILSAIGLSLLFANTLARPIARLTGIAEDISLGKNLDIAIHEVRRKDEIGTLAEAIDRLKTSVKIMMDRLRR